MRRSHRVLLVLVACGGIVAPGSGQEPGKPTTVPPTGESVAVVSGSYTFRTYCAACHGSGGKGDGPLAEDLRFSPPDLTLIAQRNGGEFPAEKVTRIVDGRSPVKGHGGPDMPVWGDAFRNAETGYDDASAKAKIRAVVDHLKTLQAPPK